MFEEVAADNAAMSDVAVAIEMPVTIEIVIPIGAVEQTPVTVPVAETIPIAIAKAFTTLIKVRSAGIARVSCLSARGYRHYRRLGRAT